ncbi:permease IIC component [Xylocopilactobacillus apicola]|uniref:Permease IIC component n=2 Tax=Xylocopilactobacillus apicola TaxID=2932184 RepID=A0AAU9DH87_9LACO|nr:permease IIC component [Xylocopilactobacillus apicola]
MQTFSTLFPFILLGSFIKYIHQAVFTRDGFFASVYQVEKWFPFYHQLSIMFNGLEIVTVSMTALVATLVSAKFLAKLLHDDDNIVGICGLFVTFLLNFNYNLLDNSTGDNRNLLYLTNFDFRYVFIGILTGLGVAYYYHFLVWTRNRIWQSRRDDHDGVRSIFPITVILMSAALLSYVLNLSSQKNITNLFTNLVNLPVSKFKHTMVFIYFISLVNGLLSFVGFSVSLTSVTMGVNSTASAANLDYALTHKNLFGVPNPVTLHTMYETYGNFGGTGLTLGLIIAILLFSRQRNLRQVAKLSLIPTGLGSVNSPVMVGIPILFNPILLIPYLVSPLVSMAIAWIFINFKWMPPAVYRVPQTTPSFLLGFLGTNGNWVALFVSVLCILASVAVYFPFLKILEHYHQFERNKE